MAARSLLFPAGPWDSRWAERECGGKGGGSTVGRWAVFREEKSPFPTGIWQDLKCLEGNTLASSLASRSALPRSFLA